GRGVAAGLCISVTQVDLTNLGGVAPIMGRMAFDHGSMVLLQCRIAFSGRQKGGVAMNQATPKGITRKAFLTSAAASTAAFALKPPFLWGKDTPLKLGAQLCMTGGLAPNGVWGSRAVEAAVKKINQAGGIKGRKVEYVLEDTETNVQTGIRKMRKLIEQ